MQMAQQVLAAYASRHGIPGPAAAAIFAAVDDSDAAEALMRPVNKTKLWDIVDAARQRALVPLIQDVDAWLAANQLPKMSLDDLWFELVAVRNGLGSTYVASAPANIATLCVECEALWNRWDDVESQHDVINRHPKNFGATHA